MTAQPVIAERSSLGGVLSSRHVDLDWAINLVDDGFLSVDRDWQVRFVNDAAARLLGLQPRDLLGRNIRREFPTTLGSVFDHRYREAVKSQQSVEFEKYFESPNVWCSIRVYPSPDDVTLVLRDVTRHRSLVAERRALVERLLKAQDRERARIAADVHEDSLQELGAVAIQLQLLRAHLGASSPMVHSLLDGLDQQVSRATGRLRTLLFRLEPTRTDVPISTSIRTQAAHIFDGSSIHWSVDDLDGGEELAPGVSAHVAECLLGDAQRLAPFGSTRPTSPRHPGTAVWRPCGTGPRTSAAVAPSNPPHPTAARCGSTSRASGGRRGRRRRAFGAGPALRGVGGRHLTRLGGYHPQRGADARRTRG